MRPEFQGIVDGLLSTNSEQREESVLRAALVLELGQASLESRWQPDREFYQSELPKELLRTRIAPSETRQLVRTLHDLIRMAAGTDEEVSLLWALSKAPFFLALPVVFEVLADQADGMSGDCLFQALVALDNCLVPEDGGEDRYHPRVQEELQRWSPVMLLNRLRQQHVDERVRTLAAHLYDDVVTRSAGA